MKSIRSAAILTLLASAAFVAGAQPPASQPGQNRPPQPTPPPPPPATYRMPAWPTPEIEKIATLLTGSWKAPQKSGAHGTESQTPIDLWMHIKPILIEGIDGTLYVEIAQSTSAHRPYRQAIFQLYAYKDKTRLRTYEFRGKDTGSIIGMWLAPEYFPEITTADLIATLDIDLAPTADGYAGKTPYPYPTGSHGAVEMTSELSITPETLVSSDRGFDAAGKPVWGSGDESVFTFTKTDPDIKVDKRDNGLIVMALAAGKGEKPVSTADRVALHYTGWLVNGRMFDSSRQRGQPLVFNQGAGLIPGMIQGIDGAKAGEIRRLIIPWQIAYGAQGRGANIPPHSTLIFETEILSVDTPPAAAPSPTPTPPKSETPGGK
jgi:FKBP-type peptidyl-prolyl cis-trans isomerase/CpeT/CpcT family (DUF1001)